MPTHHPNSRFDAPFSLDEFYAYFPEFSKQEIFEPSLVVSAGKQARLWITRDDCAQLHGEERAYAYYCLVGHLIMMTMKERNGSDPTKMTPGGGMSSMSGAVGGSGLLQSASVGGVSISMQVPQYFKGAWDWWLGQTPYGQKLLAFLESRVAIGIYGMGDDIRGCLRD